MGSRSIIIVSMVMMFISAYTDSVHAESGVYPDKIVFAQTASIEGPTAKLGIGMRDGILAAFKEVNDKGGVHNRKLELETQNDNYEPEQAIINAQKFIEENKTFAFIGGVGTPTSKSIEPLISEAKIPYIAPFTGAEILRNPFKKYVVNLRGSYFEETEEMARYYVDTLHYKNIAILYQDDSFGRAGLDGITLALQRRGITLSAEATFRRNTLAVKQAVISISRKKPDVIVMIGPYQPIGAFVKTYSIMGHKPHFTTLSFVGTEALAQLLGTDGKDIVVTEVMPFPLDEKSSFVHAYQEALKKYNSELPVTYVSLEGYLAGKFAIKVLEDIGDNITREKFISQIYSAKKIMIDDVSMSFDENDNQGMKAVYMSKLTGDGKFTPLVIDKK
jgi:branched-chain amino acid transport system substrate-binding protein